MKLIRTVGVGYRRKKIVHTVTWLSGLPKEFVIWLVNKIVSVKRSKDGKGKGRRGDWKNDPPTYRLWLHRASYINDTKVFWCYVQNCDRQLSNRGDYPLLRVLLCLSCHCVTLCSGLWQTAEWSQRWTLLSTDGSSALSVMSPASCQQHYDVSCHSLICHCHSVGNMLTSVTSVLRHTVVRKPSLVHVGRDTGWQCRPWHRLTVSTVT